MFTNEEIYNIAYRAMGTCDAPKEIEEFTTEECQKLDAIVFCCNACNWWCSTSELHNDTGEWLCQECSEDTNGFSE